MLLDIWKNSWSNRGLFDEIEKDLEEAESMFGRMFSTLSGIGSATKLADSPYYYGYLITIDPNGKPRIREFGNVRKSSKEAVEHNGAREPLVDTIVDEKQHTVRITAEMPGVNKEDIKVSSSGRHVTVHAEKGEKKYHADIPVNVSLEESSTRASYSNGVLELKIKFKVPKPNGKEIKIE
jgi:HSP20 family protein